MRHRRDGDNRKAKRAVEMPGLWKGWKAKGRLPTLSTIPLEISPMAGEIPTFPRFRRRGRMEKWKTKGRFPTFPPPRGHLSKNKTNGGGALRRLKSSCR